MPNQEDKDYEDSIPEYANIAAKDTRVAIFVEFHSVKNAEGLLIIKETPIFIHKYPFMDLEGGIITIQDNLHRDRMQKRACKTRKSLNRVYRLAKERLLEEKNITLLTESAINRDRLINQALG